MTLKELITKEPQGQVAKAYKFAQKAHAGQKRKTGEPYFVHVAATAETLLQWKMDEASIVAGLLHDIVEDTPITLADLSHEFGKEVALLVNGVTKLSSFKYRGVTAQVENLRKLILALTQDLRVIFIKFADRLHNMRTLSALPPQKQHRIASETDEIYAPLAYRLGMQQISGEFHDLAFPYLHPKEDKWIKAHLTEQYEERLTYLKKLEPQVKKLLREHNIHPLSIDFRAKRYSSLYEKLVRNGMDIEKIYDLVAMRIIVNTTEECYGILGLLHAYFPPLPGRIKDYIAMPKLNGYRSLHTTVIGPDKKIIEFQVRTHQMHEEAEFGIAAHWIYEEVRKMAKTNVRRSTQQVNQELPWLEQLRLWQETYKSGGDAQEFLANMKLEFFKDRIFVLTPEADIIDLPAGATPVDFAYNIHTDVGNTCVGAKVNNHFVGLDYELHSGDLVEILTQKGKKPSEDWLKFVKTNGAKDHIRTTLRKKTSTLLQRNLPTKTELRLVVRDRVGLIKDISGMITRSHINILNLHTDTAPNNRYPVDKIEIATTDKTKIAKLILKLKEIKDIKEISYRIL